MSDEPRDIIIERLEKKLKESRRLEARIEALEQGFFEVSKLLNEAMSDLAEHKRMIEGAIKTEPEEVIEAKPSTAVEDEVEVESEEKEMEYIIAESSSSYDRRRGRELKVGEIIIAGERKGSRFNEKVITRANEEITIIRR
ncbi:MAG: hypothetical protein SVM80_10435 [Halobacteriota archaeon]|nr:hypothetical protein [Halobacteriota archaeon]